MGAPAMQMTLQQMIAWPLLLAAAAGVAACTSEPEDPCYTDEGECLSRVEGVWCRTFHGDLADVQRACWLDGAATECAQGDTTGVMVVTCYYQRPFGEPESGEIIRAWQEFPSRVVEREGLRHCSAELWAEVGPWPLCPAAP